jgi:transcriptional regulator with XRE-family HTH domain
MEGGRIMKTMHTSTEQFLRKVGRKISEIRSQKGLTQFKLAERAGVSTQLVQYWESGRNVTLKTLYSLAQHLNHPIEGFFQEPKSLKAVRGRPKQKKK